MSLDTPTDDVTSLTTSSLVPPSDCADIVDSILSRPSWFLRLSLQDIMDTLPDL